MLSKSEIEKLVRRAQFGDEESFATIFDHFFDKIFRYIRFRVDESEAEDLTHDVFLKVVQNFKKYKQTTGFSAWIFRIAHNTVIDFYRKKRELLGVDDEISFRIPDPCPNPEQQTQKHQEFQKIRETLNLLSPIHREILELKFLEGFSNAEIAKITEKTEGNVRIIQLRALREMRKHFPFEE